MTKQRIIILGGGFAGAYCAQALENHRCEKQAEVLLINRHDYLLFYPLLVEAGIGNVETRHAVISLRAFLKNTAFRMGDILDVDISRREVTFQVGDEGEVEKLAADHLIFALGSIAHLPDVPGLATYGYSMKTLTDAIILRDRAIELLETADGISDDQKRRALLHFVVVGGNFSGVEVAGEFNSYLRRAKSRYRNIHPSDIHVTLINRADFILKELDEDLGRYALHEMQRSGVSFKFGTTVQRIEHGQTTLTNGETLATHTVIWCAGTAPHPLIRKTGLPVDERGYILCERTLRVKGFGNVWAAGDCAINVDAQGKHYPFTAQHAVKEGVHLARNLTRVIEGQAPLPCNIRSLGSLALIGHHVGVAKILRFKFSGCFAWFFYRTIYLIKLPGWSRRIRTALDWTLDVFFPRNQVQLGIRETTNQLQRSKKGEVANDHHRE
jgi:NADH:ubiquinone reductase (H+-translocating)